MELRRRDALTRRRHLAQVGIAAGGAPRALGALAATSLVACGVSGGGDGGGAPALSKTAVTLRVLTRPSSDGHTRYFKNVTPAVFQPAFPHVTVEFDEVTSGTLAERLLVLAAGDAVPDVVRLGVVADGGRAGITKGILRPLDAIAKADRYNTGAFWKTALDLFSYQGQLFGLPRAGHYGCHVLYVNQDLARRAGVRVPVADGNYTHEDLVGWGKALTRAEDGQWGWQPNPAMEECGLTWVRTFGGETFSADGKQVTLESAAAQAGLQFMADARYKHQTTDNLRAIGRERFQQGKVALLQGTPGLVAEYTAPNQAFVSFEWAATVLPKHQATGKRGTMFGGSALTISKQTRHVAESWEWVKFMSNKENGVLQVSGGAGSPGCRDDVWTDPRLAQLSPVFGLIQKTYRTPGPVHLPWNESYFELMSLINARLNPVWDGTASLRDAVQAVTREAAPILNLAPG